jgi:uncharacterized RDD family membrane protein YckC
MSEYYYCYADGCQLAKKLDERKIEKVKETLKPVKELYRVSVIARFINFTIDWLFLNIINSVVISLFVDFKPTEPMVINENFVMNYLIMIQIAIVVRFLYYFLFEVIFQRTPGKIFTRTIVVTHKGEKPKLLSILIRTMVRFLIPLNEFSIFFGELLHDKLSKTTVIIDIK